MGSGRGRDGVDYWDREAVRTGRVAEARGRVNSRATFGANRRVSHHKGFNMIASTQILQLGTEVSRQKFTNPTGPPSRITARPARRIKSGGTCKTEKCRTRYVADRPPWTTDGCNAGLVTSRTMVHLTSQKPHVR
eukprot:493455-Prorocentrum_minimum.AAC.2